MDATKGTTAGSAVGRIRTHAPDWKWVELEDGYHTVKPGTFIRSRWHSEADFRRGIANVLTQDGPRIYVDQPAWFDAIPAIADMDYLYVVRSSDEEARR